MEIQDILTLIQAVDEHGLTELKLDNGEVKLSLKREEAVPHTINVNGSEYPVPNMSGAAASQTILAPVQDSSLRTQDNVVLAGLAQTETPGIDSDKVIHSPLVGTFYNASSPEAEAFVKVGDSVKKGQVLGIIEAMKLMNEIECEFDGVVEAVLVANEDVVEYGQPLFRIR